MAAAEGVDLQVVHLDVSPDSYLRAHMPAAAPRPTPAVTRRRRAPDRVERHRLTLVDGAETTLYCAEHAAARTEVRLAVLPAPEALEAWCAAEAVDEAIVGGFFTRPAGTPLGELRTRGIARPSTPFDDPWSRVRSCVSVAGGQVQLARRDKLPAAPRGDLLQAGPLLVAHGQALPVGDDPEGFSAGAHQFDSDITDGRHPRAALALAPGRILAVACDGRSRHDAGLALDELAAALVALGAHTAINLDGGGSTSLVSGGRLRNRPREGDGAPIPGGRPVSTALLFLPRAA